MTRSATLRRVTGHIAEFAFLHTRGAFLRWHCCRMKIYTVATLPKSKAALGTDVSGEFPFSRVTAVGALIVIFFVFQFLHLISFL